MSTKTLTAAGDLGQRLSRLWNDAGKPKWTIITKEMYLQSRGSVNVSDQTVANYHHGKQDPGKAAIGTLVGLWKYYGCEADDLGPVAGPLIREFLAYTAREHESRRIGWLGRTAEPVAA